MANSTLLENTSLLPQQLAVSVLFYIGDEEGGSRNLKSHFTCVKPVM